VARDPVSRLHSPFVVPWLFLTAGGFIAAGGLAVDAPLGVATYFLSALLIAGSLGSAYLLVRFLTGPRPRR